MDHFPDLESLSVVLWNIAPSEVLRHAQRLKNLKKLHMHAWLYFPTDLFCMNLINCSQLTHLALS